MAQSSASHPRHLLSVPPHQISKELQNSSPEVNEPSPVIQKLHQNSVHGEAFPQDTTISLLRVKKLSDKAVLPSRGSPLAAAPRSGLAWKHSIDVGAGVIDADYWGPVGVILFNHSDVDFEVKVGDRIAQLIIEKIMTPDVLELKDLESTVRGEGGFGSTGV
ncbi:hypothetical protein Ddye_016837 [Dipteronia dyeriana]|uniref:Deoxyuridine 5'-triphosphate nucleotidohydrolase n=1 Tax=Dipteronia dyeriana TaxID=168575 RepID=A0AAD9U854_9ROSI|nr:hypothetical protein Ddye_016837 [Dipteronia dyeriana]